MKSHTSCACLGGPEEPWKLVSTPPATLGEPWAEQMQEEGRGRVFTPGKVRPSDPDPAGLGTESAETLPVNRADTAGEAEPPTERAELSTRPRRELRQGPPGSGRPADGAPVTTSCSSLQARRREDPRERGSRTLPRWLYARPDRQETAGETDARCRAEASGRVWSWAPTRGSRLEAGS